MLNVITFNYLNHNLCLVLLLVICALINPVENGAVKLNLKNIDKILGSNELVLINIYADWIHESNLLLPIYDEAADIVARQFSEPGKVVMAKANGDMEPSIAARFRIRTYPTFKVIRNGHVDKRGYRGQRTVEGFVSFIKQELEDPVKEIKQLSDLNDFQNSDKFTIGYFNSRNEFEYNTFRRVATNLKKYCQFYTIFNKTESHTHPLNQIKIVFYSNESFDQMYPNNMTNFDELYDWMSDKCNPLVKELTFENAGEFADENLPYLVLFYHPDDENSTFYIKRFYEVVKSELISEKEKMNFLTADGKKFKHVVHMLNKTEQDLPLIVIDNIQHVYQFPNFYDIEVPGTLRQFIQDLYSGKLHKEYHFGKNYDQVTETNNSTTLPVEANNLTTANSSSSWIINSFSYSRCTMFMYILIFFTNLI